jgi:hypothetical protein
MALLGNPTQLDSKIDGYLLEERRMMGIAGSLGQFDAELVQLGVDVLRGRKTEADALKRFDEIDRERKRLRLYSGPVVRFALAEVREEKAAFLGSPEGIAAVRANDEERASRRGEWPSERAEKLAKSLRARTAEREAAEENEAEQTRKLERGKHIETAKVEQDANRREWASIGVSGTSTRTS